MSYSSNSQTNGGCCALRLQSFSHFAVRRCGLADLWRSERQNRGAARRAQKGLLPCGRGNAQNLTHPEHGSTQ